jgi:hypothetical protein
MSVSPGAHYDFSAWVLNARSEVAAMVFLRWDPYSDEIGQLIAETISNYAQWQHVTWAGVVPSGASRVAVVFRVKASPYYPDSVVGYLNIDDVSLKVH